MDDCRLHLRYRRTLHNGQWPGVYVARQIRRRWTRQLTRTRHNLLRLHQIRTTVTRFNVITKQARSQNVDTKALPKIPSPQTESSFIITGSVNRLQKSFG